MESKIKKTDVFYNIMGIVTGINIYSRLVPWTKSSSFKSDVSAFMCLMLQYVIYLVILFVGMAGMAYTGTLLSLLPHNSFTEFVALIVIFNVFLSVIILTFTLGALFNMYAVQRLNID
jgi:hypothetical protein